MPPCHGGDHEFESRMVRQRRCSSVVELQPSKLVMRVRFPSPAPEAWLSPKKRGCFFFHRHWKSNLPIRDQQTKRDQERFPSDFRFQLNSDEYHALRSQNVTFNSSTKGRKDYPHVYTEHEIMALGGLIKGDFAAKMSIEILRKCIQED